MKNGNPPAWHLSPLRASSLLARLTVHPITYLGNIMKLRTIQQVSRARHPTIIFAMVIRESCAIFERGQCPAPIRAWLAEFCPATPIELLAPLSMLYDGSPRAFADSLPETVYYFAGMGADHAKRFREAWCNWPSNGLANKDDLQLLEISFNPDLREECILLWADDLLVSTRKQPTICKPANSHRRCDATLFG